MLTTAITGVITAIAAFFGIQPGPWVAVVWVIVKVLVVFGIFGLVAKFFSRKKAAEEASAPTPAPAPVTEAAVKPTE